LDIGAAFWAKADEIHNREKQAILTKTATPIHQFYAPEAILVRRAPSR
jgi:hypothetical protein